VTDPGAYADATSMLYALDLGAMFGILGGFTLTLASEERKLIPKSLIRQYRIEGGSWLACGLIFVLSAVPIFFTIKLGNGVPIRYYLWLIPLLTIWVSNRVQSGGGSVTRTARAMLAERYRGRGESHKTETGKEESSA
jgi:hypothetical protein